MKFILFTLSMAIAQYSFSFEIHAHRGGSSNYQRNSSKAIIEALQKGSYATEFDIHLTKDKKFVVSHDPVIDLNKCYSPIKSKLDTYIINKLTFSEVLSFKCGGNDLQAEPIASLEDILIKTKVFTQQKLNMELKFYRQTTKKLYTVNYEQLYPSISVLSNQLNKLLLKHNVYHRVIVQSFSPEVLLALKSRSDLITTSFLYKGDYLNFIPEPLIKIKPKARRLLWIPNYKKAFEVVKNNGFDYFSPNISQINSFLFKRKFKKHILKARKSQNLNFKILPWTVNSKSSIKDYINDVDGIITDHPENFID